MGSERTEVRVAKTVRLHILAKELGVQSKEIIAKCGAEGIHLKNHMAAIPLGLAESIREWFSVGEDVTSVETAPQVDLEKVRVRRPRRSASADESGGGAVVATDDEAVDETSPSDEGAEPVASAAATAPPTVDDGAGQASVSEPAADDEEQAIAASTTSVEVASEVDASAELVSVAPEEDSGATPAESQTSDEAESQPAEAGALVAEGASDTAEPEAEGDAGAAASERDDPVAPAGPQVVPRPAELQGPRVVRIEAPEQVRAPRPRPPAVGGGGDIAARQPGVGGGGGADRRRPGRAVTPAEEQAEKRARSRRGELAEVDAREREWRDQDLIERKERLRTATGVGMRKRRVEERRRQASQSQPATAPRKTEIEIQTPIILKEFCAAIGVPFQQVMMKLREHTGQLKMINQTITGEEAELVAMELGLQIKIAEQKTAYERLRDEFAQRERKNLQPRPPIVAMLGHVDHGKTSLLDRIRESDVAAGEAGGITQHIGASRITRDGFNVTFLDTPGHEAFTQMRARGADLTDVVVLVVAADDGVMPQTVEAISHAKAAGVQIVVALNKIDLEGIDLNRVYAQLAERELTPTEWGGETDVVKTSATSGLGVDELLAHLSTLAELMELSADPTVPVMATVIEAEMAEGQGVVARILVQEGTLENGQVVVCGPGAGRVRSLLDHRGRRVDQATPGTPVTVVGLDEMPNAGDRLYQVDDLRTAVSIAAEVKRQRRQESLKSVQKAKGLEELLTGGDGDTPVLNLIVKADVQGSLETLQAQLGDFPTEKAQLKILHAGVGAITEADVALAQASSAIVVGFHVVAESGAKSAADAAGVEIRQYRVIYEILADVHKALEGLLAPIQTQETRAKLDVRQVFNVGRLGTVAGCYITDGAIHRNHKVRLIRDGRIVVEGSGIQSLRRFKDDVREVKSGFECGVKIENYDDVKPGDVIEAFEVVEVSQQL